jgi:hypothetical protein
VWAEIYPIRDVVSAWVVSFAPPLTSTWARRLLDRRALSLADALPEAQTTLLGLSVPLPASLPRTWKAVMSSRMPNTRA